MSIYSPTVLPTSGRAFANALGQGVNTYLQTRRRKQEDDLEAEQRQRAEAVQNATLGEQGIHLMKPGELPPQFNVNVTGGPNPDEIVSRAINPQAPTPTGQPLAAALSRNLSIGPGYYVDRDEQAQHLTQQATIAQAQALAKALGEGTAQNILDPTARADKHAVAQSTVAKNTADASRGVPQQHVVDPVTGEVTFFDPTHPPANLRVNPAPHVVQPSFTPVTVQSSADAPPEIKPFNTKTGTVGPTIGGAKQATRIESATNTAAKARLEAAVSEMNNAHKGMEEYETALRNGTANINGLQQFASRVANSFTHDDPVSMTIQSTALATLNRTNPELARYIRRALSFAEGESMISQRPSDFRTKMSAFLSAAASGASPEMIHDIEQRRTSILDPLNRTVQPGPTRASAPSSGDVDLRQPASKPPLAERIQQLRQQGLSKEAAKAQLQQEGYDLHGGE